MKVLFTYDYGKEKMKSIVDLGYDLIYINEHEIANNYKIEDIDVLVCYNPFDRLDINKLKKLKWIQLSSIGIDQLPKQAVLEKRILVTNNKSGYSIPMGEWIVLKILEMQKNSRELYIRQGQKQWKLDTTLTELYNKTICFLGTGSIAQEAAKRLQGFEVQILGINTTGRTPMFFDKCYTMADLDKALGVSDVVILSIPYTQSTHHLINRNTLELFKKGSHLINISRGSVVDESALVEALKFNRIGKAALDVFEEEPLSESSPLWDFNNAIITPHNSWISEMRNERRFAITFENLKRYINGEKLLNIVDVQKGY